MSVLFSADLHFFHKNIILRANRRFDSVEEMNERLVDNWNRAVGVGDDVYLLGDVSFGSKTKTRPLLDRLHGRIHLVRGNHDHAVVKPGCVERFEWVRDLCELRVPDEDAENGVQHIVLCHYPLEVWNNVHHGAWHLHGHSHGTLTVDMGKRRHDVGVDNNFMRPVSYERVKQIMAARSFVPVDHHGSHETDA